MLQDSEKFGYTVFESVAKRLISNSTGQVITSTQANILRGFYDDLGYKAIAKKYNSSHSSTKTAGAALLSQISDALGFRVKKGTVVQALKSYFYENGLSTIDDVFSVPTYRTSGQPLKSLEQTAVQNTTLPFPTKNFLSGLNPESREPFLEHQALVNEIANCLQKSRYRLMVLYGMVRTGKTALLRAVVAQLKPPPYILYCQAKNIPTLNDLYQEIFLFFNESPDKISIDSINDVIKYLSNHKCIIIIDGIEAWFKQKTFAGEYKETAYDYLKFFQQIVDAQHESCIVLSGRYKPKGLNYSSNGSNIFIRQVPSLSTENLKNLLGQRYNLKGTKEEWQSFLQEFGHNIGLLISQAIDIRDYGAGQLQFLQDFNDRSEDVNYFLSQVLEDCSKAELKVIYWLYLVAGNESKLREFAFFPHLGKSFRSLQDRSLIVKSDPRGELITQLPIFEKRVIEEVSGMIAEEIINNKPSLLHHVPIALSTTDEYSKRERNGLRFLAEEINKSFNGDKQQIQKVFASVLENIRHFSKKDGSYGAGTILNTALMLKIDISKLNFTNLSLKQADLQNAHLIGINFAGCNVADVVFRQGLFGRIVTTVSSDGTLLAIGDECGTLMIWSNSSGKFELLLHHTYGDTIVALSFAESFPLVVATSQGEMYCLNGLKGHEWSSFQSFNYPYCCLAVSPNGNWIATGDEDANIYLWSIKTKRSFQLDKIHQQRIRYLAFSPNSRSLISVSEENLSDFVVWDIVNHQFRVEKIRNTNYWVEAWSWQSSRSTISVVENNYENIAIQDIGGYRYGPFKEHEKVSGVALSGNGMLLAVSSNELKQVSIWNVHTKCRQINLSGVSYPVRQVCFISNDALLLLFSDVEHQGNEVSLWRVEDGKCLQKIRSLLLEKNSQKLPYKNLNFQNVTGMAKEQARNLENLGAINLDSIS